MQQWLYMSNISVDKFINFVSKKLAAMGEDLLLTTSCSIRTFAGNSGKAFTAEKLQVFYALTISVYFGSSTYAQINLCDM